MALPAYDRDRPLRRPVHLGIDVPFGLLLFLGLGLVHLYETLVHGPSYEPDPGSPEYRAEQHSVLLLTLGFLGGHLALALVAGLLRARVTAFLQFVAVALLLLLVLGFLMS